jgi:AcrR family transcriptional regulator
MPDDKPHGKDEVMQRLVAAAVPLIAERGVKAVTTREVASAANVNQGLITRYFGTKEVLMERVAEHVSMALFRDSRAWGLDLVEGWDRVSRDRPTELRALIRIILDQGPESRWNIPIIEEMTKWLRQIIKVPEQALLDDALLVYMTVTMILGASVVGTQLQRFLELDDSSFQKLRPRAVEVLRQGIVRDSER